MTWDLLFFGVFCLFVISYLAWDRAHRDTNDGFLRDHPMYDLKRKDKDDVVE